MSKSIIISNCRYDCEGRSAGAMQGVSSTSESRTFPKIQVKGYQVKIHFSFSSTIRVLNIQNYMQPI